jgi:urocanate hydratase
LTRSATAASGNFPGEAGLGGKLLYARELTSSGCARVLAGNVAGCATLSATADVTAQKQSIRDGVVDFLVTSLDEALRILKNEIRQRKTVAVCVGAPPDGVEREMIERGVQPDLVFVGLPSEGGISLRFGEGVCEVQPAERDPGMVFLTWRAEQAAARWMPILDQKALSCLRADSWEHRWIRLAPRYLGRSGLQQRVLLCDQKDAEGILHRFAELVRSGAIGAAISGSVAASEESTVFRFEQGEIPGKIS